MRIPRFGKDWLWTAQEGVSLDVLANGPGHYPETPLPGEDGNSAFAAHRAGHGDPFINFEQLEIGDDVYLSQKDATWTYEITTKPEIINPDGDWVLDTFAPGKWLTLTTCWPKYGSEKRMYVRAKLVDVEVDKDAGSV
jgi:sortase A